MSFLARKILFILLLTIYTINLLTTEFSVAQWLEHPTSVYGRSWVQFPSGAQIFFCVLLSTHIISFIIREFKQIATATSTTAVVDAVSWGEYVS